MFDIGSPPHLPPSCELFFEMYVMKICLTLISSRYFIGSQNEGGMVLFYLNILDKVFKYKRILVGTCNSLVISYNHRHSWNTIVVPRIMGGNKDTK